MPIGFQPGARPQKTYILPPADAPRSSSAGSGNAASLVHLPCAWAAPAKSGVTIKATATVRTNDMFSSLLESRPVLSLHRAVDDIHRPLPRKHPAHFARRSRLQPRHRLLAVPGGVRRENDVLASPERMRVGERLGIDGVERAAGDLLGVERA